MLVAPNREPPTNELFTPKRGVAGSERAEKLPKVPARVDGAEKLRLRADPFRSNAPLFEDRLEPPAKLEPRAFAASPCPDAPLRAFPADPNDRQPFPAFIELRAENARFGLPGFRNPADPERLVRAPVFMPARAP